MLRLEFEHYDLDQDETIQGIDFARSILSAVSLSSIDTYLDRAAQLPDQLKQCRVSHIQPINRTGIDCAFAPTLSIAQKL